MMESSWSLVSNKLIESLLKREKLLINLGGNELSSTVYYADLSKIIFLIALITAVRARYCLKQIGCCIKIDRQRPM